MYKYIYIYILYCINFPILLNKYLLKTKEKNSFSLIQIFFENRGEKKG